MRKEGSKKTYMVPLFLYQYSFHSYDLHLYFYTKIFHNVVYIHFLYSFLLIKISIVSFKKQFKRIFQDICICTSTIHIIPHTILYFYLIVLGSGRSTLDRSWGLMFEVVLTLHLNTLSLDFQIS